MALVASILLLAGCGGDADGDDQAGTTTVATQTVGRPETTTTTTVVTAAAGAGQTRTADLADGAGCSPPPGDDLPDGRWFGFVEDAEGGTVLDNVAFDLACWFTGEAAVVAAAEDGEESPPPNDFHIRNANETLRRLPVDPAAVVNWLPQPGDPATAETVAWLDWLAARADRAFLPGVWLDIEQGVIVAIEEQYVP